MDKVGLGPFQGGGWKGAVLRKMANLLLVDTDGLAQRAMKGILARGNHRLAVVENGADAWELLRRSVKVDLLVVELKLKGEDSLPLIERLKADPLLGGMPALVYTGHADKDGVRRALSLRAQNVLLKPYRDDALFAEIAKATADPWRKRLFARPAIEMTPEKRRALLAGLQHGLEEASERVAGLYRKRELGPVPSLLDKLALLGEKCGAPGIAACLRDLERRAAAGSWPDSEASADTLSIAARLIACQLDPGLVPEDFRSEEELEEEEAAAKRDYWLKAADEDRCPVVGWDQLKREMDNLNTCPVVDSIAAAFQMSANGHPTSLAPLLDLVQRDAGLSVEVLSSANRIKKKENDGNASSVEEPRMAVGLLGELRLAAMGGNFGMVEERSLSASAQSPWTSYQLFQLGTARMARWVCNYLELPSLMNVAYTAGLIHDFGKLLLAHLHPYAFQAIHAYAARHGTRLVAAERHFLTTTTHEMAAYFAEKQGLPPRFVHVLRWMEDAREAVDDAELVAVVSLARDLCRHNHVGGCGETAADDAVPIAETPEWEVLKGRVYLNFDLKKFETLAYRECLSLRRELLGQIAKRAVA